VALQTAASQVTWKVANIRELQSLVDYGNSPTLTAGHPFIGIDDTTALWTSNTDATDADLSYIIGFRSGQVTLQQKQFKAGCILVGTTIPLPFPCEAPGEGVTPFPCPLTSLLRIHERQVEKLVLLGIVTVEGWSVSQSLH